MRRPGAKTYRLGTHRSCAPEATWARLAPLTERLGITRVADVTGLDRVGIPVVMVTRPNARSLSVFQGKGATLPAARVSGVMEAAELFHAEHFAGRLRRASHAALAREERAVDPLLLPHSAEGYVHPEAPMLWAEGRDLRDGAPVWVPHDAVHADFTAPPSSGLRRGSNGLGAGNTRLEAVAHALFEVIERDATTLWSHAGDAARAQREVNLDSVDDASCRELLARLAGADLGVRAWAAASDVGVPVYVAEVCERGDAEPAGPYWRGPTLGSGCHAAREVALARAIAEAAQARTTFIAGARDDMTWEDFAGVPAAPLAAGVGQGLRPFRDSPTFESDAIGEDLAWALGRLEAAGYADVLVVDLNHEGIGVPVVRVIVPGLEGPDEPRADYVPGARVQALAGASGGHSGAEAAFP